MLMKKVLLAALIATSAIGTVAIPQAAVAASVYINVGPPPMREEIVPVQRRGYMWAPGHWDYRGNRHVWINGSSVRERRGYTYQPHRWVQDGDRWHQQRGHWERG